MAERSITDWAGAATKNALREVLSDVIDRGMQGWLEKRSGGQKGRHSLHHFVHHIVEHWDRRYFVLPPKPKRGGLLWPESAEKAWVEAGGGARHDHVLKYYKSEDAYRDGEPPLAGIDLRGATVDLLHVKGSFLDYSAVTLHFILHTRERELKLKASCAVSYERWLTALAGAGVELLENSVQRALLSSPTFQALKIELEMRRRGDERTLRQAAGLGSVQSLRRSLFGGELLGVVDVKQLDEALLRSEFSGVDPSLIRAAKERRASVHASADASSASPTSPVEGLDGSQWTSFNTRHGFAAPKPPRSASVVEASWLAFDKRHGIDQPMPGVAPDGHADGTQRRRSLFQETLDAWGRPRASSPKPRPQPQPQPQLACVQVCVLM